MKAFTLANYASKKDESNGIQWVFLEFCPLGFIGKLFVASELNDFIAYLSVFYNEWPCDWLLATYTRTRACPLTAKDCISRARKYGIDHKIPLFQHVGLHSSLKGKKTKAKVKNFSNVSNKVRMDLEIPEIEWRSKENLTWNCAFFSSFRNRNFAWVKLVSRMTRINTFYSFRKHFQVIYESDHANFNQIEVTQLAHKNRVVKGPFLLLITSYLRALLSTWDSTVPGSFISTNIFFKTDWIDRKTYHFFMNFTS